MRPLHAIQRLFWGRSARRKQRSRCFEKFCHCFAGSCTTNSPFSAATASSSCTFWQRTSDQLYSRRTAPRPCSETLLSVCSLFLARLGARMSFAGACLSSRRSPLCGLQKSREPLSLRTARPLCCKLLGWLGVGRS